MSDIDKRLDEILEEYFFPEDVARNNSNDKYLIYGAKAIKQLMVDEFEKIIGEDSKFREPEDDLDRGVQIGYDTLRNELRQKLEEWKK